MLRVYKGPCAQLVFTLAGQGEVRFGVQGLGLRG